MRPMKLYSSLALVVSLLILTSCDASGQDGAQEKGKGTTSQKTQESKKTESKTEPKNEDPALTTIDRFIAESTESGRIDKGKPAWKTSLPKPPMAEFQKGATYWWNLETSKGQIKVRLMPDVAPMHVSSTIYLTRLGFYDDLSFHRVISGFMAQGGDPLGNGRGSPGYKYAGEFSREVQHDRPGLLSMANAGPNTDGSQFFLTFVPTPHLNMKHTIFGEVKGEAGMAALRALEAAGSRSGATTEPLKIIKAVIEVEAAKADEKKDEKKG